MGSSSQCAKHGVRGIQLDAQWTETRRKGCGLTARQLQHGFTIVQREAPIQNGERAQPVVGRKLDVARAGQALQGKKLRPDRSFIAREDF